ncbi:MAG: hypothetical protein HRU09_03060 [Oligoflexales bacterium]|nr:hypothetical protein [Oligoflexales bacterium]
MQIKTFEAFSMREAVQQIKKQFGSDAVILSTKEKIIEDGNTKVIEVKAAVSEENEKKGAFASPPILDLSGIEELDSRIGKLERQIGTVLDRMPSKPQVNQLEAGLRELKLLCTHAIRQLPNQFKGEMPISFESIYEQLKLMGIEETYLFAILNHLKSIPSFEEGSKQAGESAKEYLKSHAIRYMFQKIKIYPRIKPTKGHSQIHLFFGGSGVGKSCTIAKIAANFQNKEKANVLLVSYDNNCFAANDVLSVYAKVLGIDHVMIEKPEEIEKIVLKHRHCELILIDTKGGVPKSSAELKPLLELKEKPFPIDMHLVLSLTENNRQMDHTVNSFSPVGIHSIVFSKLDESWTYGEMYNLACKWSLPLSFFSTGPKVPDDLELASRERVIERLFGL